MIGFSISVLSGIIANQIYDWFKMGKKWKRPDYVCHLIGTCQDELSEKKLRTKTSPSDYGIELYNLSDETTIIDYFDVYHNKQLIIGNCEFDDKQSIAPNQKLTYTFMEQDADALCWHCEQECFTKCIMCFHTVNGRTIKTNLDISAIALQIVVRKSIFSSIVGASGEDTNG